MRGMQAMRGVMAAPRLRYRVLARNQCNNLQHNLQHLLRLGYWQAMRSLRRLDASRVLSEVNFLKKKGICICAGMLLTSVLCILYSVGSSGLEYSSLTLSR